MRSVSQIYSEAVATRNNYLQLTELNTGRSNSKVSMLNLLTYVVAVCIHTYEAVLDVFQVRMVSALKGRINGTADWYAAIAKKFQYNSATEKGDELRWNDDTLKIEYVAPDASRRIIEKAAWQMSEDGSGLILKVCKSNPNSNEIDNGTPYAQLSDKELTAFKLFIQEMKFIGADVWCQSYPADILTVVADAQNPVFYSDSYVTAAQALKSVQEAMIEFAGSMEFNGYLYYQDVLDVIRKADYISEIGNDIKVYVTSWNSETGAYGEPQELIGRMRLKSGYVRLLDLNSTSTISASNITLVPYSQSAEYYQNLG